LPLTKVVVAQNIFTFTFFQALEPRTTFTLSASIIGHKHAKQSNKQTKNNTPIKRETLKERTKGRARSSGSLKNTKGVWKGLVSFKEMVAED
jgi:hypothetical protein